MGLILEEKSESACKPGSVVDSHSSGTGITASLKQPTRIQREPRHWIPIWSCSERGLPCHALLPGARCALTAPFHPYLPTEVGVAVYSQIGRASCRERVSISVVD